MPRRPPVPIERGSRAEIQQLIAELAQLKIYQELVEQNFKQAGYNLTEALKQAWVGSLTKARQRNVERKKAAEAAKWADLNRAREWLFWERRRLRLSVKNTTAVAAPASPETPEIRKEKADRLNEQVWRASYWLLIAASIGKQILKPSLVVLKSGSVDPSNSDPSDATRERSQNSIEALAHSFRNWINRVRVNQPHSPDSSSGGMAHRAASVDPGFGSEEDINSEMSGGFKGVAHLDPNDVSDKILAVASTMVTALKGRERVDGDWADSIFMNVINILLRNEPPSAEMGVVDDAQTEPTAKAKEVLLKTVRMKKTPAKSTEEKPEERIDKLKHKTQDRSHRPPYRGPSMPPPPPSPSIYDPSLWQINTKDPDDGVWASEVTGNRRSTEPIEFETGFMTWDEQEAKFPLLLERLRLHSVEALEPMIFDPATVDTQIWDLLNRSIAESTKGRRSPLHLNPITIHSLSRWAASESNTEVSLDPLQLPDNPPIEIKKRPLSSSALSVPRSLNKQISIGLGTTSRSANRGESNIAVPTTTSPTKETPAALTDQPEALASVHYPLKSPTTTSISALYPEHRRAAIERRIYEGGFTALANIQPSPPGPPTPYPKLVVTPPVPITPTVALYKEQEQELGPGVPGESRNGDGNREGQDDNDDDVTFIKQVQIGAQDQGAKLATFVKDIHQTAAATSSKKRRLEEEWGREGHKAAKAKRVTYLQKNTGQYSGSSHDDKAIRYGDQQQQREIVVPRLSIDWDGEGTNRGQKGRRKSSPLSRVVTIEDVSDAGEPIPQMPVPMPSIFVGTTGLPSAQFNDEDEDENNKRFQAMEARWKILQHQHQLYNRFQSQPQKKQKKTPPNLYTANQPPPIQTQTPTPTPKSARNLRALPTPSKRRKVRFQLDNKNSNNSGGGGGPNRGMLEEARRAIQRYDATTARVGPLGTIPDRERAFDVDC